MRDTPATRASASSVQPRPGSAWMAPSAARSWIRQRRQPARRCAARQRAQWMRRICTSIRWTRWVDTSAPPGPGLRNSEASCSSAQRNGGLRRSARHFDQGRQGVEQQRRVMAVEVHLAADQELLAAAVVDGDAVAHHGFQEMESRPARAPGPTPSRSGIPGSPGSSRPRRNGSARPAPPPLPSDPRRAAAAGRRRAQEKRTTTRPRRNPRKAGFAV